MDDIAKEKRHQELNNQLSEILHQYLLACDALHKDRCADIGDNLITIQRATLACHRIMGVYKCERQDTIRLGTIGTPPRIKP